MAILRFKIEIAVCFSRLALEVEIMAAGVFNMQTKVNKIFYGVLLTLAWDITRFKIKIVDCFWPLAEALGKAGRI